eukprot:Nk52_evm87s223 gene=Nk52_evmTU87s223
MLITLLTVVSCVIGLTTTHWTDGDIELGLGSACRSATWGECSEDFHWRDLDSKQQAMIACLLTASLLGFCAMILEGIHLFLLGRCRCCTRSVLHFAAVLVLIQAMCMSTTLLIFPSAYDLDFDYPPGTHVGWTMYVVIVGTVLAYFSAAVNLAMHRKRANYSSKF